MLKEKAQKIRSVALVEEGHDDVESVHDFLVKSIDGKDVALADYKGKVLLIVNVASKCGFTNPESTEACDNGYGCVLS